MAPSEPLSGGRNMKVTAKNSCILCFGGLSTKFGWKKNALKTYIYIYIQNLGVGVGFLEGCNILSILLQGIPTAHRINRGLKRHVLRD